MTGRCGWLCDPGRHGSWPSSPPTLSAYCLFLLLAFRCVLFSHGAAHSLPPKGRRSLMGSGGGARQGFLLLFPRCC